MKMMMVQGEGNENSNNMPLTTGTTGRGTTTSMTASATTNTTTNATKPQNEFKSETMKADAQDNGERNETTTDANGNADPRDNDSGSGSTSDKPMSNRTLLLDGLKRCSGKCSTTAFWKSLPEEYQVDKEFVLTCLQCCATLPDKSDFERKFPQSLRFDKDVVLAFAHRPDFFRLYEQRHLYVPDCLTNDKQVMLQYCKQIPRSLQECSEELTDDKDVVEAAIALDGLELQYASPRLQENEDIVKAACFRDGRALEFCPPGALRDALTSDRQFMLQVLRKHGGSMLRLVPQPFQEDKELLLEALTHGMRFRFCPFIFSTDKDFLLQALDRKSELYLEFNRATQTDPDLALAAVISPSSTPSVHAKAIALVPSLKQDRQVALAVAQRGTVEAVKAFFVMPIETETTNTTTTSSSSSSSAYNFTNDKEIVLAVLKKDIKLFQHVSDRLKQDKDVLWAAMDTSTAVDVYKTISRALLEQYPQLTVHAITVAPKRSLRFLRPYVSDILWRTNKQVAMAWMARGNRCMEQFDTFLGDEEFALALAKCPCWVEFRRVHDSLRRDFQFMMKAVHLNGRVLIYAAPHLHSNYALVVRAVANTTNALTHWPPNNAATTATAANNAAALLVPPPIIPPLPAAGGGGAAGVAPLPNNNNNNLPPPQQQQQQQPPTIPPPITKAQLKDYLQEKLHLHQVFVGDFLRGIAVVPWNRSKIPPRHRSALPLLDRGVETSQAFKRLIAEFLGVPMGQELHDIRTAHANLVQQEMEMAEATRRMNQDTADMDNNNNNNNNNNARPARAPAFEFGMGLAPGIRARERERERELVMVREGRLHRAFFMRPMWADDDEDDDDHDEEDHIAAAMVIGNHHDHDPWFPVAAAAREQQQQQRMEQGNFNNNNNNHNVINRNAAAMMRWRNHRQHHVRHRAIHDLRAAARAPLPPHQAPPPPRPLERLLALPPLPQQQQRQQPIGNIQVNLHQPLQQELEQRAGGGNNPDAMDVEFQEAHGPVGVNNPRPGAPNHHIIANNPAVAAARARFWRHGGHHHQQEALFGRGGEVDREFFEHHHNMEDDMMMFAVMMDEQPDVPDIPDELEDDLGFLFLDPFE